MAKRQTAATTCLDWTEIDKDTDAHGICRRTEASNLPGAGCLVRYSERQFVEHGTGSKLDATVSVAYLPNHRVEGGALEFISPQ